VALWRIVAIALVLAGLAVGVYAIATLGYDGDMGGSAGDATNTPVLPGIVTLIFGAVAAWCAGDWVVGGPPSRRGAARRRCGAG
jgi:hypothetical protein